MSDTPQQSLEEHYHQSQLITKILSALQDAGLDHGDLKCADLELLEEFHIRGRQATVELAESCGLQKNHEVLDLGCGIGGPARFLAETFGCKVVGLDLVESYIEAAKVLTEKTRLDHLVSFKQGDMQEMPFADDSFDRIWSQHTLMNIADKSALAKEVRRILRPGGKAVFYEVCSGNGDPVHLPVPWASSPQHSHLCSATELRNTFGSSLMVEELWEDVTGVALDWLDGLSTGVKIQPVDTRPRPGLGLLMGKNAGLKSRNLGLNLRQGRIVVVRGVFSLS